MGLPAQAKLAMARGALLGLVLVGSSFIGLGLSAPPSPLAAADHFFESVLSRFFAPAQPQGEPVVIIGVTEETLERLPFRSPVDRGFLARTITALAAQQPRVIGLDILLDQPTEPKDDLELRRAIDAVAAPVVLASVSAEPALSAERRRFLDSFLAGHMLGDASLPRERFDGIVRNYQARDPEGEPSFAAAVAQAAGAPAPPKDFRIAWRRAVQSASPFPVYPAHLIQLLPPDWLRGKIVLIGSLVSGQDEHRTPISIFSRPTFGVEIHAHAVSQILVGEARPPTAPWIKRGMVTLAAAAGMALATGVGDSLLIAGLVLSILVIWVGFAALFALGGPLLLPMSSTVSLGVGAGCTRFWSGRRERQDHRMLRQIFSRFVSEPVVRELWRERATLFAGGRPKPRELIATVLFCDVAGFTPICERLPPEPLVGWLNRYIDTMVESLGAHNGIVLRFVGDGILAVFGAPVPRSGEAEIDADAQNAVRSALAMVAAMHRLNAEWRSTALPGAAIRIGIHTGPLVAGSLGSGAHMEYCLLGDTANIGARLEALGKEHSQGPDDCIVLVSGTTYERLHESFVGRAVGEVTLRGKACPTEVYRILDTA
jgi:class 3 adenylate cyclase/CHASE2 domain-containing sensor protein